MLYLLALAVGFVVGFVIGALSGVLSVSDGEEIVRLRKMMEQVDELLKAIDRPVSKDGLRSWRYDIHVARSRIIRDGEQK